MHREFHLSWMVRDASRGFAGGMISMKRILLAAAVVGMLLTGADFVHAGPLGYKLDVTAAYAPPPG